MRISNPIWQQLRENAEAQAPRAITTNILGRVFYTMKNGVPVSEIPHWVRDKAAEHGLSVVAADFTNNTYTLQLTHCAKCGGNMKTSKAIDQTWSGRPEWEGDTIYTMSPGGPGKLIDCLKCEQCGWSMRK